MNRLIKSQLALEEARGELGTLLDTEMETRSSSFDGDVETAKNKVKAMQFGLEAAALLEPDDHERHTETVDSEELELRGLVGKANVGNIMAAAIQGTPTEGPERELQQHYGMGGMSIPMSLLETRAETTIAGDNTNVARPVLGQLFPTSIASFAGVSVETVPSGEAGYPVITTGATVQALAQGASGTESTGAITITTLVPKRLQASLRYQREDAARLSYLDASLRENLSMALAAKLDEQILNRATVGLLTFGTAPTVNGATVSNLAHALAALYGSVDGIYAQTASEVRLLLGDNTYPALGKELVGSVTVGDVTVGISFSLEKLGELSGGVRVSTHVPDYASNRQDALAIIGPPRRNAVAAVWSNLDLVVDPYTAAADGEVIITVYMMQDSAILRTDGYKRYRFK